MQPNGCFTRYLDVDSATLFNCRLSCSTLMLISISPDFRSAFIFVFCLDTVYFIFSAFIFVFCLDSVYFISVSIFVFCLDSVYVQISPERGATHKQTSEEEFT
jgi:hypothetical protein